MRTPFRFILFLYFSICGFFAVTLGYDLFHVKNPGGLLFIFFHVLAVGTLFLGLQLLNAFTDPLPAWYTYFLPTSYREPETDRPKTLLYLVYGFIYVGTMTFLIGLFIGPRLGFSLERIVLPFAIGVLAFFVLISLLQMFAAFLLFWKKDGKIPNSGDKAS